MTPVMSVRTRTREAVQRRAEVWSRLHLDGVRISTIAHIYGVDRSTVARQLDKPRAARAAARLGGAP